METHNKQGKLTKYGLSCGYFEREKTGNKEITLTRSHGIYYVSLWDIEKHESIKEGNYPFYKLQDARKFIKQELKN